jgi:hypothetical protein
MDAQTRAMRLGAALTKHLLRFMTPYEDRFESCWALYSLSDSLVQRQHADSAQRPTAGDTLIWGIGASSVKTYKGVLYLAGLGHGTQASMLNRALIENTFTAKSWTGLTTSALHKSIRETWGDANEQRLLDHIAAASLRYTNLRLHSTAASLVRPRAVDEATSLYEAGESVDDIAGSLLVGFWAFANSCRLLLGDRAELLALYDERMPTFFRT